MLLQEAEPETYAAAGVALAATAGATVPLAGAILRYVVPQRVVFFARWGFSHALAVLAAGVLGLAVFSSLLPGEGVLRQLHLTVLTLAAAVGVAVWHARRMQPEGIASFGFHGGLGARSALAGLCAYVCLVPAIVGVERLWPTVQRWIELEGAPSPLVEGLLGLEGASLAWAVFLCVLLGPLLEELLFRGYLQPLFVQNFSEKGGIAVTSLLFAALHGADAFLPLFALSCLLGAIQVRTQRLLGAWTVHAVHNALVIFVAFRFPEVRELVQ
ncbi:MAG: CPBP family intramembrane glutamic endopeptidase [Planctomycetota bacterium]